LVVSDSQNQIMVQVSLNSLLDSQNQPRYSFSLFTKSGIDPAGMATEATEAPGGGGYVLSGAKTWISNSPIADVFVVWAKCKWDGKIRGFVMEKVSVPFLYEHYAFVSLC